MSSRFEYDAMKFLRNLLDPEMYGHAVTEEVRNEARKLLGIPPVDLNRPKRGFTQQGLVDISMPRRFDEN